MGENCACKDKEKIEFDEGIHRVINDKINKHLLVNVTEEGIELYEPEIYDLIVVEEDGEAYNLFGDDEEDEW